MSDDFQAQQIIAEYEEKKKRELSARMSELGKKKTRRKSKAARESIKKAHAKLRKTWWSKSWRAKHAGQSKTRTETKQREPLD